MSDPRTGRRREKRRANVAVSESPCGVAGHDHRAPAINNDRGDIGGPPVRREAEGRGPCADAECRISAGRRDGTATGSCLRCTLVG
jgi:hypothetical protein